MLPGFVLGYIGRIIGLLVSVDFLHNFSDLLRNFYYAHSHVFLATWLMFDVAHTSLLLYVARFRLNL